MTLEKSYILCQELTSSHYENFPVAKFVPKNLQKYVASVYAFARTADDIADENYFSQNSPTSQQRLEKLALMRKDLYACINNKEDISEEFKWIFVSLADCINTFKIDPILFDDLLSAFEQDSVQTRYETFEDIIDYSRRSANPVGRLVLLLHKINDEALFKKSDAICTALQLANFWQDVSVDYKKDRIYIPKSLWQKYGISIKDFEEKSSSENFKKCIKELCQKTNELFDQGKTLPKDLPFPLSLEIFLTINGGLTILKKIAILDFDTVNQRPKITKKDKLGLLFLSIFKIFINTKI